MQSDSYAESWKALEARKEDLLSRMRRMEVSSLRFRPRADSWCLLEVADHLLKAESSAIRYVRSKMDHVQPGQGLGLRSRFGFPLLYLLLRSSLRLKIPAAIRKTVGPDDDLDWEGIETRWRETRSDFESLLVDVPDELEDAPLFRHPIAGRTTLVGMLEFLAAHFDHHLHQVERIVRHPDFPSP